MKDYELARSRSAQPFLFRICMLCAYTRPRYQVSVYRTIGPLVFFLFSKAYDQSLVFAVTSFIIRGLW